MEIDPKHRQQSLAKDDYLVAVKLLLRKGPLLLVTHDIFGAWDIPGGRIRRDQFETPLEDILKMKIDDELGNNLQYKLGDIKTTIRVERREAGRDNKLVRIFGVCYEAEWVSGEPELGDHHDKIEWIDLANADLSQYGPDNGWVAQLTKYQESI